MLHRGYHPLTLSSALPESQPSRIANEGHIILRLPVHIIGELLEMDELEVPEDLLVLSTWHYVFFHARNLSRCYILEDTAFSTATNDKYNGVARVQTAVIDSLSHQGSQHGGFASATVTNVLTPSTATTVSSRPETIDSFSDIGVGDPSPVTVDGVDVMRPEVGRRSVGKTNEVNPRKRRSPPPCPSNTRPHQKRCCEPERHTVSTVSSYRCDVNPPSLSCKLPIRRRLLPLNQNISFVKMCEFLNLPSDFLISLVSTSQQSAVELKTTIEFIAVVLLYKQLESKLRYVLISPSKLLGLDSQFANSNLIKQAILYHVNTVKKPAEKLLYSSHNEFSDEESDVERRSRIEKLSKRILKPNKNVSFRRLRSSILRLYGLKGYMSNLREPQSQSCAPRRTIPFRWKVDPTRLGLQGLHHEQIIVRGELQPPPGDWIPAVSLRSFKSGFHEFFFRLDNSGFNNIIIGITSMKIKPDDELTLCW